jgi:hypothetical protein
MIMKCKNFALGIIFLSVVGIQGIDRPTHLKHVYAENMKAIVIFNSETGKCIIQPIESNDYNQHYDRNTGEWKRQNSFSQTDPTVIAIVGIPVMLGLFTYFLTKVKISE